MRSRQIPARIRLLGSSVACAALAILLAACQTAQRDSGEGQPAAPILSSQSDAFIGLGDDELSNALGQPDMVWREAPAEVWQYDSAMCVVDFYLYSSGGRLEVAYVEARDMLAGSEPTERCVKSLLQSVATTTL